jgi:predicted CopG family antitoxin
MKNVTVTMDEEVAQWARVHAAKQGKSVSRMIGELLVRHRREQEGYEVAMRRFLTRERGPIGLDSTERPSREELHDRGGASWARER